MTATMLQTCRACARRMRGGMARHGRAGHARSQHSGPYWNRRKKFGFGFLLVAPRLPETVSATRPTTTTKKFPATGRPLQTHVHPGWNARERQSGGVWITCILVADPDGHDCRKRSISPPPLASTTKVFQVTDRPLQTHVHPEGWNAQERHGGGFGFPAS
jgi:hypothetical protein